MDKSDKFQKNRSKGKPQSNTRNKINRRDFDKREIKEVGKKSIHNDPNWYMSDQQLINDVASISFNTALGNPITLAGPVGYADGNLTIPGIMSIYTMPTIGISEDANSPVNIAMRRLYTYVRHANSGHSNYDPADLMIYILAMDSIYTFWAYMVRIYGVAQVFSRTNKYVGDAYLKAMTVDASDIRKNMADFRAYINMFGGKAMQWCVPKVMTYFLRHNWMYSNIYKDEDTSKSQVYMYVPAGVYKYSPTISAGAGGLQVIPVAVGDGATIGVPTDDNFNTFAALRAIGDELLSALSGQEDIGIISGDILKAYGAENLWTINTIPEDYAVAPVFSEEVLAQIHNTNFASNTIVNAEGTAVGLSGLNVFQDTSVGSGILIFAPVFNYVSHLCYDQIMDFWKESVTSEDIMVASRNMMVATPYTGESKAFVRAGAITSCGSEICLFASMWTIRQSDGQSIWTRVYFNDIWNASTGGDIYNITRFNEAPTKVVTNSSGLFTYYMGEIDNFGIVSRNNIKQMHEVALMSMFGVPYLK